MSRFQDCSASIWEYGEKEMVLRWVETGKRKKKKEGTLSLHHEINQKPEHQPLEPTDLKLCNPQHVFLLGHFGTVVGKVSAKAAKGSDAINEPTCEKLAWLCRFFVSTQYSSQSCSPLVAAMFFVTAFIWFETPVWSCNALFSYLLVLFTFLLFQFSLESLCHKGGPIIIQLSSLLHSVHHGEQLVQCVSVTAQENRTLISWQHTAKTRHNICFRRTRIFSDKNMCTEI